MERFHMALLMEEEWYWNIVERSMPDTDQPEQFNRLVELLIELPPYEIRRFDMRTEQLLCQAHKSELWCAATIMNRSYVSDDSFIYFKTWLISRGKDVYYQALNDPDTLIAQINPQIECYEYELFRYGASMAFKEVSGKHMSDNPYPVDFPFTASKYPSVSFWRQTKDGEDMRKACPKLYDTFCRATRPLRTNARFRRG